MRRLSLRQIRAVLAVHRLGKISLVARETGVTPPAVTLQLQQAEAAAGTVLFDRTSDGLRATDAGQVFIAAALDIEQRLALLAEELAAVRGAGRGTLRLGAVSTAKYFVPRLLGAFAQDHPGVDLRLTIGNRAAIIAALEQQEIDFGLMGRPPRHLPVRTYLVGEHPLVIIAPPDHPLVGKHDISRARIAAEPLVVREPGSGTRNALELFLAESMAEAGGRITEFSSNETIKQAVIAGLGIALISAHTIELEAQLGLIRILDVVDTPVRRQWFLVNRADRAPSPSGAAFRAFIAAEGRSFLPAVAAANE